MKRKTIKQSVLWKGVGLHSGNECAVRLHPGEQGIQFQSGSERWQARWDYVRDTSRCTVIGAERASIMTVEHLLSALYGAQITDAVIEVEGGELPILDGSAHPFFVAICETGLEILGELCVPALKKPVTVQSSDKLAAVYPDGKTVSGLIYFDHPMVGSQAGAFEISPEVYGREIAPARTFGFDFEVEALRAQGLAAGGSIENALVISREGFSSKPRFADEPLRHKLLDLLGDIMLVGAPLYGVSFLAVKAGHALHIELAREVAGILERKE